MAVQDGEQAVKTGIIGIGFMGRVHAAAARAAGARITRVADNRLDGAAAPDRWLHAEKVAASAAELLGALNLWHFINWMAGMRSGGGDSGRILDSAAKRALRRQVRQLVAGLAA